MNNRKVSAPKMAQNQISDEPPQGLENLHNEVLGGRIGLDKSNGFRFLKTGYYRVNAWADQHGQGGHYRIQVLRNGGGISYAHRYQWNDNGWEQIMTDLLWHFTAGQYLEIKLHADHNRGNTYIWHAWNTQGSHSRVQVSYEAESAKDAAFSRKPFSSCGTPGGAPIRRWHGQPLRWHSL